MESDDLRMAVATVAFLHDLKALGYEKVWIGVQNPHWQTGHMNTNSVVAEPRRRSSNGKAGPWEQTLSGSPALWTLSKKYQGTCGNGLLYADQMQFDGIDYVVVGYYDLSQIEALDNTNLLKENQHGTAQGNED